MERSIVAVPMEKRGATGKEQIFVFAEFPKLFKLKIGGREMIRKHIKFK